MWQHHGFPCTHAVAVLHKTSHITGKDIMEYVEPYFHVCFYKKSLEHSIHPVTYYGRVEHSVSKPSILPPISKKLPGRPKKERIPSGGENVRMQRCSRCGKKARHNRKVCREIIME